MSALSLLAPVPPSQAAADNYDSDADDHYTPPAPKSAHPSSSRPRSGSQSCSFSSVSGDSADDGNVQSDSARPLKRQRTIGTRSGPGLEEGESSTRPQPTLSETASPKERLTFAQLQALDRSHTRDLLAGMSGKGKQREVESDGQELVRIRVKRRFAGEDVWEEKMVLVSSKEAQIWGSSTCDSHPPPPPPLTGTEPNPDGLDDRPTSSAPSPQSDLSALDDSLTPLPSQSITVNPSPSPPFPSPTTRTASTPTEPVPPRRSPPKKRKGGGLSAAALKMRNQGKKMSTLEKSSRDWRAHRSDELTEEERYQLARNRQEGGGGFLEKQEFLTRVAEYRGR